ncbi:MAG: hypothetical protein ACRDTF_02550 [Pseudonocardiaceae bacterium]
MTLLALSVNETTFWVVVGLVVAVLVVGVIALTTTLLRLVGSVNHSMRQLQEVVEVQAGQVHAAELHAARAAEEAAVGGDATAEPAAPAESAGESTNGELPAVDSDAKGRKRGGASEG